MEIPKLCIILRAVPWQYWVALRFAYSLTLRRFPIGSKLDRYEIMCWVLLEKNPSVTAMLKTR